MAATTRDPTPPDSADRPPIVITDLFATPDVVPLVAGWIYDEFWADRDSYSASDLAELLRAADSPDSLPVSLLAWIGDKPVGTVNLIENDDPARTHLRPWLAALVVVPEFRRRGIGSALVKAARRRAVALAMPILYLGTDNPRFYKRLGATVYEPTDSPIVIMRLETAGGVA